MSKAKSNKQVYIFAIIVCVACSVILAGAATLLQPRQAVNVKLDIVKNILVAVGHTAEEVNSATPKQVFDMYAAEFSETLVDAENQGADSTFMKQELITLSYPRQQLDDMGLSDILRIFNSKKELLARRSKKSLEQYDPGYKLIHIWKPSGSIEAYVIPIEGYGLWDIIKGYVALEPNLNTIKGISFYEHKETPGLGARITEDWFKEQFKGKQILEPSGELASVTIVRGVASDQYSGSDLTHHVDGISGATLTCKGINQFLSATLATYEPFFATLRKAG